MSCCSNYSTACRTPLPRASPRSMYLGIHPCALAQLSPLAEPRFHLLSSTDCQANHRKPNIASCFLTLQSPHLQPVLSTIDTCQVPCTLILLLHLVNLVPQSYSRTPTAVCTVVTTQHRVQRSHRHPLGQTTQHFSLHSIPMHCYVCNAFSFVCLFLFTNNLRSTLASHYTSSHLTPYFHL